MSTSFAIWADVTAAGVGDNTTRYYPISGGASAITAEADAMVPVRFAGVFSKLFTVVSTNTASVNSVITLRKSAADTSVTVTYASDQTGIKQDNTNTSTFANTDEGDYSVVVPTEAGTNTIAITVMGIQFDPTDTTKCVSFWTVSRSVNISSASTTDYYAAFGNTATSVSESIVQTEIRDSFTLSNFYTDVSANARTTDVTFRVRINASNGNQTVTYTAGQTGSKEDTSNTDTVVSGDDYCYSATTGTGTETLTSQMFSVTAVNTSRVFNSYVERTSTTVNFNTTTYFAVGGRITTVTTESSCYYRPEFTFTAKQFVGRVATNTIATSPTVITFRDNEANSSISLSYNAAETGIKSDTSNTATITGGADEICIQVVTPNTSGALSFSYFGFSGETAVSTGIKTWDGLARASIKTWRGLADASVKTHNGIS